MFKVTETGGGESLPEVCAKRAKTADGSLGAVSILCLLSIRGKMLENSDLMSNISRTCKELQTYRHFECPKSNGLNLVSQMSPTDCLHRSVLVPCLGYCKWRPLTSPATHRAPPSSRSVHYRNGPQPSSRARPPSATTRAASPHTT
jgi:hypothetical protein